MAHCNCIVSTRVFIWFCEVTIIYVYIVYLLDEIDET